MFKISQSTQLVLSNANLNNYSAFLFYPHANVALQLPLIMNGLLGFGRGEFKSILMNSSPVHKHRSAAGGSSTSSDTISINRITHNIAFIEKRWQKKRWYSSFQLHTKVYF